MCRSMFVFWWVFCSYGFASDVADSPAVRITVGGVCGSGTLCGASSSAAYVVTNAHVVGTQVGREVVVDCLVDEKKKAFKGRIVWAAYSSTRLIDVAIVEVSGLTAKMYRPMHKGAPSDQPFATRGSPRCVWPLVDKDFSNPDIRLSSPLMLGDPDAVGGQSGSSIFNSSDNMVGLVTWSWGGRCAGQQTGALWSVVSTRSVLQVAARPVGLVEVQSTSERSATEDGIFSIVAISPADLPIWVVPRVPPVDPCVVLTAKEVEIIQLLRSRDGAEKAIDWAMVIKLILELIAMFRS